MWRPAAPPPILWLALLTLLGTAGCGEGAAPVAPVDPMRVDLWSPERIHAAYPRPPRSAVGPWYGQEIWISWLKQGERAGQRYPRSEADALALAKRLYREVRGGAELGALARNHSDAPGQRAYGYGPLLALRAKPDDRDRVLIGTPVGRLTPLIAWQQGFWFARRVGRAKGKALAQAFHRAQGLRGRARAIVMSHQEAHPQRAETASITRTNAAAWAERLLGETQGGTPFEELARRYSHDGPSKARGGLLHLTTPREGEDPSWLRWGDQGLPRELLEVVLETGRVGRVHPVVLDTARGYVLVEILARREQVTPPR